MQNSSENDQKKVVSIATMVRVRPLLEDELECKECIKCADDVTIII